MQPVTFILFGATGDLAVTKIFPALSSLFAEGVLHPDSRIIAVSRRDWDTAAFRSFLTDASADVRDALLSRIEYADVDFDVRRGYEHLANALAKTPAQERLVYLSLAPQWFAPVIEDLRENGILERGGGNLLLEKPFGTDESSARALNELLLAFLDPSQIYRVDHYLGKAAVQALMKTHEASPSLRSILSNETVTEIVAELLETKGIDGRGASYDSVGAFRDVGQNHLLEMLAVLLAEYPRGGGTRAWQDARAKVLESLALPAAGASVRIGQYEGYEAERGVEAGSQTETAFEVRTKFMEGELAGIPVTLRAGKKMPRAYAGISVFFTAAEGFPAEMQCELQPEARVIMRYPDRSEQVIPLPAERGAYANVIFDALRGDDRHFVGEREIMAAWRYADALLPFFSDAPLVRYNDEHPF